MKKPRHRQPVHFALAAFAALAAAMLLAAPAAHAFTYETKNYNNGDDNSIFLDPDKKVEQFGSGDVPAKPGGGPTFHFEVGPSNNGIFGQSGRFNPAWGPQPFPDNR
jgi:hypothetical protein